MKQATIRSRANALACHLLTAALAVTASAFLIHTECEAQDHYVEGARIKHNGISKQYRGVNAPHMFGGSSSAMAGWGIDIVREYISDVNNVPTGNTSIQDPQTGQWLHGLRKIVNDNRAHGKITILCPFQWNLDGGWEEEYCGKIPNGRTFYSQHRARLRTWAYEFRNDSDVWISPWNEPTFNSEDEWLWRLGEMIDDIRSQGNNNIVFVPVNDWAQDETVLFRKGNQLKSGRGNILFDIHCYADWMGGWQSTQTIQARFQAVKNAGFAAAVGEVGCNVGFWNNQTQIRDVSVVLDAAANVGMSCLAWHWKDSTEHDSLLTGGQPNDNGNYWFGSKVKNYCLAARTPDIGGAPIGQTIAFWSSASGKYVTTDLNNSNLALAQWATTVGTWERYQVVDAGSGLIALKSLNNGYFLSADLTRADKGLRAAYQNAAIGAWEKFQWVDAGNGEFGLKSNANNFFVSANMNEGQMLQAGWATTIQGWEKFGWHSTP